MNKVVLVTGGTRGIGEFVSRKFASKGYDVIICYKTSENKAIRLKDELEEKHGVRIKIAKVSLEDENSVNKMVDECLAEFGKIDVLVNNAGIAVDKEFDERTVEDWRDTVAVNLIAPFILTKLLGKVMYKNKYGVIINIASTNGINTFYPTSVDYDASKAGLINLTHNSAIELSPYVRVNAVAPGWVNTEMNRDLDQQFVEDETNRVLLKRFAQPEEIANVVYFLASDDASFINSEIIKVDGGWK